MASEDLKTSRKIITTSSISMSNKSEKPPKGAIIKSQNVTTSTEEIENGWLIVKRFDGYYWKDKAEKDKDSYGNWFNYEQKWYSEEDPLTITLNDKALADAFDDDDVIG